MLIFIDLLWLKLACVSGLNSISISLIRSTRLLFQARTYFCRVFNLLLLRLIAIQNFELSPGVHPCRHLLHDIAFILLGFWLWFFCLNRVQQSFNEIRCNLGNLRIIPIEFNWIRVNSNDILNQRLYRTIVIVFSSRL